MRTWVSLLVPCASGALERSVKGDTCEREQEKGERKRVSLNWARAETRVVTFLVAQRALDSSTKYDVCEVCILILIPTIKNLMTPYNIISKRTAHSEGSPRQRLAVERERGGGRPIFPPAAVAAAAGALLCAAPLIYMRRGRPRGGMNGLRSN